MPGAALILLAVYAALAFGMRIAIQLRRTGASGFAGMPDRSSPVEMLGGALFVLALLLSFAGPVLQLAGQVHAVTALEGSLVELLGALLACAGIAITVLSQLAMGDAWRIGVDSGERTKLVTGGPFKVVRNPIYTAMLVAFGGIALLAPDPLTLAGAIVLVVALELHIRCTEEPYLIRTHGEHYAAYASRVGRLLPGVGRLRPGRGLCRAAVAARDHSASQ